MRWRLSFRNRLPGITRVGGAAAFCVHVAHLFSLINFGKTHESFKARATYTPPPHLIRPTQKLNERNKQHRKNVCDFPLFRRNVDESWSLVCFGVGRKTLRGDRMCSLSLPFCPRLQLRLLLHFVGGLICHNCTKHVTSPRSLVRLDEIWCRRVSEKKECKKLFFPVSLFRCCWAW